MNDLRIVYLIGQLGRGGSERQLYLLLSHMPSVDRHVLVFNPQEHPIYKRDLEEIGVTVTDMPGEVRGIRARMSYVYRYLRRLRPQVVHSWTFHDNAYAWLAGLAARVPVRLGSLRASLDSSVIRGLSVPLRWACIKGPSHIVVNWPAGVSELGAHGLPKRRAFFLPNCIPPATPGPPADLTEFGFEAHHRVIGAVANLHRSKNHALFIDALAEILPQHPDTRALIVGKPTAAEPEVYDLLKSKLETLGLQEKVVLAGFRDDVPALMRRFDLYCHSSLVEGSPNAVLEAMAAGLPVVATDVHGLAALVVHRVTGYLVPPADKRALAAGLARLLDNPETAKQMGVAGRQRIESEFGCQAATDRLFKFYQQLLA